MPTIPLSQWAQVRRELFAQQSQETEKPNLWINCNKNRSIRISVTNKSRAQVLVQEVVQRLVFYPVEATLPLLACDAKLMQLSSQLLQMTLLILAQTSIVKLLVILQNLLLRVQNHGLAPTLLLQDPHFQSSRIAFASPEIAAEFVCRV